MKSKLTPCEDHYRYNVRAYTIPDGIGYNGCGYGWIEVDDAGFVVRIRYANSLTDAGSLSQDDQFDKGNNDPGDRVIINGVLRIYAQFSCYNAFIPTEQ